MPNASPDLYIVRKIHAIKSYLQDIEIVVRNLKTELDLTRQLLFRAWLRHQAGIVIENNDLIVPNEAEFITKQGQDGNTVLLVQNSIRSNYDNINNQLKELGFYSKIKKQADLIRITNSKEGYKHIKPFLSDLPYECFYLILLNMANHVIKTISISEGGVSGTTLDCRKLFKIALDNYTSSLILTHNHPSGNTKPSDRDQVMTKRIIEAGKLLDIKVIDHLIVGNPGYFSFADEGLMS